MNFLARITVMPLRNLLDPQGKAVLGGLHSLGLKDATDVRIGKQIELSVEADDESSARKIAEEAAQKLLANPVMEQFEISFS